MSWTLGGGATVAGAVTRASIEEILRSLEEIGPEPLGQFMLQRGADPADGWILMLPSSMRDECEIVLPRYVRWHPLIDVPLLMRMPRFFL